MAEIWGAAIAVGGAVISGVAADKKAKQDRKDAKVATKDEAKYAGILSQFEKEQDYFYEQKKRADRVRGLDNFRKFGTVANFAPNYKGANTTPVVPEKPNIDVMLNPGAK